MALKYKLLIGAKSKYMRAALTTQTIGSLYNIEIIIEKTIRKSDRFTSGWWPHTKYSITKKENACYWAIVAIYEGLCTLQDYANNKTKTKQKPMIHIGKIKQSGKFQVTVVENGKQLSASLPIESRLDAIRQIVSMIHSFNCHFVFVQDDTNYKSVLYSVHDDGLYERVYKEEMEQRNLHLSDKFIVK